MTKHRLTPAERRILFYLNERGNYLHATVKGKTYQYKSGEGRVSERVVDKLHVEGLVDVIYQPEYIIPFTVVITLKGRDAIK